MCESVQDSDDGATWAVLPFSTPGASGQLTRVVVERGQAVLLIQTARQYLRVSVAEEPGQGVYVWLVEFPPRPRAPGDYGS